MSASFKIQKPDEVEYELRMVLPLGSWKKIAKQLSESKDILSWPCSELRQQIWNMVGQAEKVLEEDSSTK
jgi:hypothetical protein